MLILVNLEDKRSFPKCPHSPHLQHWASEVSSSVCIKKVVVLTIAFESLSIAAAFLLFEVLFSCLHFLNPYETIDQSVLLIRLKYQCFPPLRPRWSRSPWL